MRRYGVVCGSTERDARDRGVTGDRRRRRSGARPPRRGDATQGQHQTNGEGHGERRAAAAAQAAAAGVRQGDGAGRVVIVPGGGICGGGLLGGGLLGGGLLGGGVGGRIVIGSDGGQGRGAARDMITTLSGCSEAASRVLTTAGAPTP